MAGRSASAAAFASYAGSACPVSARCPQKTRNRPARQQVCRTFTNVIASTIKRQTDNKSAGPYRLRQTFLPTTYKQFWNTGSTTRSPKKTAPPASVTASSCRVGPTWSRAGSAMAQNSSTQTSTNDAAAVAPSTAASSKTTGL